MIVTDQVPTVPDVTTSAQSVSRSYCGEITHCQFAEFVALGVKLSAIFMSELSIYTASICAGVWDTQELCCFALWWECSLLVNSIFGPTLVIILLANITWHASFCQSVLLS